jgi:hypothetical protein
LIQHASLTRQERKSSRKIAAGSRGDLKTPIVSGLKPPPSVPLPAFGCFFFFAPSMSDGIWRDY